MLNLAQKAGEINHVYGGPLSFKNSHQNVDMTFNTTDYTSDTTTAGVKQLMDAKGNFLLCCQPIN